MIVIVEGGGRWIGCWTRWRGKGWWRCCWKGKVGGAVKVVTFGVVAYTLVSVTASIAEYYDEVVGDTVS